MTATSDVDAVVVGGGHHGLVAAAILADAGWDVLVLEAGDRVGGAIRSERLHPGYVTDLFSAFHPLAAASPVLRALDLHHHGLTWSHAPAVLAHPLTPAGPAAVLHRDPDTTAAGLDALHPGDGAAWLRLCRQWRTLEEPLLRSLATVFPPVRGPLALLRRTGTADALRLLRFLLLPATRMGEELFGGEAARLLLAGNTAHADVPVTAPGSGVFGWLLAMLGQHHGFPTPTGGTSALADALARRAQAAGAQIRTSHPVARILVSGGRAVGVATEAGTRVRARKAVLADVTAPALYTRLLPPDAVPARLRDDLRRFVPDTPVVKVNWALDSPIPWQCADVGRAGTVHVGAGTRELVHWYADLETGTPPREPFLLVGQMTTTDPARSAPGTESAWAYTHLPRGVTSDDVAETLAHRAEAVIERYAPGFGARLRHRVLQRPGDLAAADPNLDGGTINAGTALLFQQLIFRPTPGLGRPETPIANLYLAGAAAHPGGGVHGFCGHHAARAALRAHRSVTGRLRRAAVAAALNRVHAGAGPSGPPQ